MILCDFCDFLRFSVIFCAEAFRDTSARWPLDGRRMAARCAADKYFGSGVACEIWVAAALRKQVRTPPRYALFGEIKASDPPHSWSAIGTELLRVGV